MSRDHSANLKMETNTSTTHAEIYAVGTKRDGAPVKNGREIENVEYIVLATSVQEAVEIVQKSITDETEEITKAWHVTHLTRGLAGLRYLPKAI